MKSLSMLGSTFAGTIIARRLGRASSMALATFLLGCAAMPTTGNVTLNGVVISGVEARPDITVSIAEFREGGGPARLAAASRRYAVTLVSRDPIAVLEGQLPVAAVPAKFTVAVQNGRTFHNCLVAGLASEGSGGGYRLLYAFRCEDIGP